jgi:hypothetical protein
LFWFIGIGEYPFVELTQQALKKEPEAGAKKVENSCEITVVFQGITVVFR